MKNNLTNKECVDKKGLDEALSQYMQIVQHVPKGDMGFIFSDFEDPQMCEWIWHEYLMPCKVDGRSYTVYPSWTNFTPFGLETFSDVQRFKFYTLTLEDDPDAYSDEEYEKYERLYVVDPIDPEDFPEWTN